MRTLKVATEQCKHRAGGGRSGGFQAAEHTDCDCRMFPNRHRRTCGAVLFLAYHRKSHSLPEFCAGIEWIFAGGYFDFIL